MKLEFQKTKYPDGSFTTKLLSDVNPLEHHTVTVWINSYEDLMYLLQIKDILDFNDINNVTLQIPCLLDAQADRRFASDESSNLKLVCQILNFMKWHRIRVFHPHNPEVVEALVDNVQIVDNVRFIEDVMQSIIQDTHISETYFFTNTVLMSTDAGGFKPLMKLSDKLGWTGEVFSAAKSRQWNAELEKSLLTQQVDKSDFGGKDILIIDDLCVYGGTFVGLSNLLKDRNCGKLYLAISHVTVQNPNKQLEESFHQIFTTDSKYQEYNLKNLTVLKNPFS